MDQKDSYKQAGAKADVAPAQGRVRVSQKRQLGKFLLTGSLDLKNSHPKWLPF